MPVYQYKDVHYDLPDGLSNEQALSKIKTHLGETEDNFATKAFKEAGSATTLGNAVPGALEALAGGVGSMANMAVAGIAGPVKSMFTGKSAADEIGNVSHAIEQAIPYMPETESGKAYLNLLSLPVEGIQKLGEKAFEATGSPLVGAGVETIGNAAMLGLPALKRGKKPVQATDFDAKLKGALDETPSATPPGIETIRQHELFDQPEQFRGANPYEAVLGDWRVDENGIPIKADLSMDVQNAQQPLQRNLWGDELAQKHPQENAMSLPEAIDSMPNLPWKTERDTGIDLLNKGGMGPEGRLDAAIMEATPGFKVPRSQRGGVDFSGDFSKGKEFLDKILSRNLPRIISITQDFSNQTKEISPTVSKYTSRRDVRELINDMLEADKQDDPIKYWQEKLAGVTEAEDPTIGGQMQGSNKLRWGQAKGPRDFIKFNLSEKELADLKEFGDTMIALKDEFYAQHRKAPEPVYPEPENYKWKSGKPEYFHDKKMENKIYARDYAKFEKQVEAWNKETDEINKKFADEYGINPEGFDKSTHEFGTPEDFLWDAIHGLALKVKHDLVKEQSQSVINGIKVPRSQRGAIDTQTVKETIDGFKRGLKSAYDVLDSYKGAFHPSELAYMREKISTPKSRDGVVLLSPDEFHALAASRSQDYLNNKSRSFGPELKRMSVREGLKSDKGLSDIPWLLTKTTDGVAKVTGHEGRHRMDVFKEMGIEQVPVLIRDSNVRWGEGKNEYNPAPPTKIIGENSQIARAMPEVLNHKYDSNGIRIPRSQRGALDLGPNLKSKQEAIEKIVKEKIFATPPKAEEVVADSTSHGKDSRGINSMEAGASLAAMKRRSPLILGVSRIIQHAKNVAEDGIRTSVFPTERKLRSLKSEEITNLSKIMIEEERAGKRLSATQLADLGLSEKQLIAYESVREMSKQALARENAARAAQGKKPITEREAFVSSRWKGDFRRPFLDKEGRLKWYLAADSKGGLEVQTKALLEKFPELVQGKDHQTKSSRGFNEHPEEIYSLMVDVLGRDDPAVAKIHEWMMEQGVNEARGMLAQEKHFKNKSGVRGFVGDRPSNTLRGKLDQRKEALAFFQEQINYAKNAHKWSGMQEAAQELKKVFADKTLQEQQPNNMAYAKDYFRNQIGLSTHKAIAGLEDAVRETGISPHVLNNAIGDVKSLWITQKLVAAAGFIASNVIQAANILPHLIDMAVKYRGNPLYAIPMGLSSGMLMAAGHMSIAAGKKGFYQTLSVLPKEEGAFLAKAMKYAEDNSVVARSIYDEAPIASSFSKTAKISQIGGKTITAPETVLRSIAYMTYVNMLKSSGKFKNDLDIFRLAEERTNISMADYRQGERAMLFDKLGTVGNAMNTLQTFPINYYQQWNWAAREAKRGNVLPAAVMFATQAYVAGAMGIPGFADTDKLWNWMKELAAEHSPQLWDKMKDIDLKEIMLGMGNSALYGGLSEQSGISFTSRAAAPAGSEMLSSPLGPYADFGRQLGDVGNALVNPSAQSGAQALLSVAPTGMQGALEVGPLKDQTSVLNQETGKRVYGRTRDLASREGQVARSPQDELIRATGLRSQREVVERDQAYRLNKLQSDSNTVIAKLPNKIYNELRNNNMEKATDLINLYSRLSGSQISSQQIENEAIKEFTTSSQRATMGATTVPALVALKRLQQIQERQKGP